jgi:hypothetical protein
VNWNVTSLQPANYERATIQFSFLTAPHNTTPFSQTQAVAERSSSDTAVSPNHSAKLATPSTKLNLGKRERGTVKKLYQEITENPLFVPNEAFPVGQAKFVIWWRSTFPGPEFPSSQAIREAIEKRKPSEFNFASWDPAVLQIEEPPAPRTLAERISFPEQTPAPRPLAERITIPLANRITIPVANRITVPLARRITFPADNVQSGRIHKKRRGGSKH